MSTERQTETRGHGGLYFVVGALVVAVVVLGYFILGGQWPMNDAGQVDVNVTLPDAATGGDSTDGGAAGGTQGNAPSE